MNVLDSCSEKSNAVKLMLQWNKRDLDKPLWMWLVQHKQNQETSKIQCYSCKEYGHIASQCKRKMGNYCKKFRHIISEWRRWPQNRNNNAIHAVIEGSASTVSTAMPEWTAQDASLPSQPTLTPEMVRQMIQSACSAFSISGKASKLPFGF